MGKEAGHAGSAHASAQSLADGPLTGDLTSRSVDSWGSGRYARASSPTYIRRQEMPLTRREGWRALMTDHGGFRVTDWLKGLTLTPKAGE